MTMLKKEHDLPTPSVYMAWAEFVEHTGILPARLEEIIEIGWLEPDRTQSEQCLFRQRDIYRVRKLERICMDFELPAIGGTIIVDLLERIDLLEQMLKTQRI